MFHRFLFSVISITQVFSVCQFINIAVICVELLQVRKRNSLISIPAGTLIYTILIQIAETLRNALKKYNC